MGEIKRMVAVIVSLGFTASIGGALLIWRTGYSVAEMDWDANGRTSLAEMLNALDVGRRLTTRNGVVCKEYFDLKDGLLVRLDCPAQLK